MQTLALVGATGRLGGHVLHEALRRGGWVVRALVREPAALPVREGLVVVRGDVRDATAVAALLQSADALVSCLGTRRGREAHEVLAEGMAILVRALAPGPVPLVAVASAGILDAPGGGLRRDAPGYPAAFRAGSAQHLQAWRTLGASGLPHTLVCPPELVEGPRDQPLQVLRDVLPPGPKRVSMPALAAWMLDEARRPAHAGHRVGINNGPQA
ncbi:MAG: NAD(P)H-binding protein [Candidatus Sericytochromatia bacterium]|nr:NAD(P)H-binding protein [Candidatus Sericytochromatia bacterium]